MFRAALHGVFGRREWVVKDVVEALGQALHEFGDTIREACLLLRGATGTGSFGGRCKVGDRLGGSKMGFLQALP